MRAPKLLRNAAAVLAALLVGLIFSAGAQAAPGDLDPTFSGDGEQVTDFASGLSDAAAIVRQPNGKIVAVGPTSGPRGNFALARYNRDGALDPTFAEDGRQVTDFGSSDEFGNQDGARGVALQQDGKILVVGRTRTDTATDYDFALARYNANGTLDASFSGDGKQVTDVSPGVDGARGVAIQPDGRIVVVGDGGGGFALARYNPNGSLDPTFSGDGRLRTDFGGGAGAYGVALQANGRIIVAGESPFRGFALARYRPNGSLDPAFSGDGKKTTDFSRGDDGASAVALDADGKIVAVGHTNNGHTGPSNFALARYRPDGSLDPSFSGDGMQVTDFGTALDQASGVALQANGKIVAAGRGGAGFGLARYKPNGSLDPAFSGDGRRTTNFSPGDDGANAVALQGDGRVVAAGRSPSDFALARYRPDGSLDTSFSGNGLQTTDFAGFDEVHAVALQADGRIVAAGRTASSDFALARYRPDGSLDTSFSGNGRQTTDFGAFDEVNDVALQANGKIVAVGRGGAGFGLARYKPNGSLDPAFSGDGKQLTDFGGFGDRATGLAVQPDGKIVVVGSTLTDRIAHFACCPIFALARYNPNGTLDTSFSDDGMQTTNFAGGLLEDQATGVALQGDGKIVVVGDEGGGDFAIARYKPNGTLDSGFAGDGMQTTDFGGPPPDRATGVALQGDGKIVAVGDGAHDFALARYGPDGSLDPSFSGDGRQTTDFGALGDRAAGVALQGDGKILVVGVVGGGAAPGDDFALARYSPDGSLDPSFSGDGTLTTDFGGSEAAFGVALQPDGRVVAAGRGLGADLTSDFAIARYLGG